MEVALSARYRIASKARLGFDPTRGKHMLLYPERGLALNEIGYAVLKLCDGNTSVSEMVAALSERFAADAATVQADVVAFLLQLAQRGLIEGVE